MKYADGTEVTRDSSGHPTQIKQAGGRTLNIEWDSGEISKIKQQGGSEYIRGSDGKWTDPEGNPVDINRVVVHPSADIEIVGTTGSNMLKVDGTTVRFDDKQRPTTVTDKSGKIVQTYAYDDQGLKSYTVDGKTYRRTDKDTWVLDDGKPNNPEMKQTVQVEICKGT